MTKKGFYFTHTVKLQKIPGVLLIDKNKKGDEIYCEKHWLDEMKSQSVYKIQFGKYIKKRQKIEE